MARIQDIASAAGVGVGTVSRMINGNGYVSQEKREKIQAAMEKLGYVPKKVDPRKMEKQSSKLIGVVVPYISHPFFSKMVQQLEFDLSQAGYRCLLFVENSIIENQEMVVKMLEEQVLAGVINFGNMPYGFKGREGVPMVVFDRNWTPDVPIVRSDHIIGGQMAAEYFLSQGCKKVVQFIGGSDLERSANIRYKEIKRVLEASHAEVVNIFMDWDAMSYHYNREMIRRYIDVLKSADGCITNDIGALCCQIALQNEGVHIPDDFCIVAYDGTGLVELATPYMPAVEQDIPALCKCMVDVLMNMINGNEPEKYLYEIPTKWK